MTAKSAPAEIAAAPAAPRLVKAAAGEAGSRETLVRLNQALADLRAQAVVPILQESLACIRADKPSEGAEWALKALECDDQNGWGWYLLGICRDKAGDLTNSLRCYEHALQLLPDNTEIANDLGRLAYRLGMKDVAEKLFHHYLLRQPGSVEGANNLACALRDQLRFEEAIETLQPVIYANPEQPLLWNTVGTVLVERGDVDQSPTFFEEALRLDPGFAKARYNLANTKLALGDAAGALQDCELALPGAVLPDDITMMNLARSTMLVASGDLARGWDAYEVRLDPGYADVTHFLCDQPAWTPEAELSGKTLLVFGEQGLGDEVLFANVLPDVLEALGPDGRLILAVERRLVSLFQRSFPAAEVGPHGTWRIDHHTVRAAPFVQNPERIDYWTPVASLLRRFRRSVDAFPARPAFLVPDPERAAHWKAQMDALGPGPKVGLLWKSLRKDSGRARFYSPFDQWAPVLKTPGVAFVNLQYGDCEEERALARSQLGVDIHQPEGIDLKEDLDDLAALCSAVDLVVGPANATSNIAAAVGSPLWLISTPGAWPRLGTDRYPWYPTSRLFSPTAFNQWEPVMAEIARELTSAS